MVKKILFEIDQDPLRKGLNKYTRKAFQILPELNKPRILDIGCGSGVPTMELARLCNGQIIGLDINQPLLDELKRKAKEAGFLNRVKVVKSSMSELDFPDESFDIIWAEGSISRIGFKKGLEEWRQFIKLGGFLIVHDEMKSIEKKLKQICVCGYKLLEYFKLSGETWWIEYYCPLEKKIRELRPRYIDDSEALKTLDEKQNEIDMFKKNPRSYGSVFFIMQKR